jgi:hypothetical protein
MFAVYWTDKTNSERNSEVFETRQQVDDKVKQLEKAGHLFVDVKSGVEPQNYLEE